MDLRFPFTSRVVDLPPAEARAAFDALAQRSVEGGDGWSVETAAGRLDLERPALVPAHHDYWPYRQAEGWLWSARSRRPVPVQLEVLPWSNGRVELALTVRRPSRWLGSLLARAYAKAGPALLTELGARMVQARPAAARPVVAKSA